MAGRDSALPLPAARTVADLRARVDAWRAAGDTVALVPTMGALHHGHGTLMDAARAACDRVIASIFVNPAQFGPNEDFDAYPRDEARDAAYLTEKGVDLLYAPGVEEIYPAGFATAVSVGALTDCLCGAHRPGHFDGVATVVAKLLIQARPDRALFGEKDFQQLSVIRRMAQDLDLPVAIDGVPTVREADGLATSSRNAYLTADERAVAPVLNRAIVAAAAGIRAGGDASAACATARATLAEAGFGDIDYVECRDALNLRPVAGFDPVVPARVFAAACLGRARLIDNVPV